MPVAVDQLQGKEVELVKGKEFWVSSKFYMARATLHYLLFERFPHKLFSSKVKYLYSIVLLKSFLANAVNLLWKQKMHCLSIFEPFSQVLSESLLRGFKNSEFLTINSACPPLWPLLNKIPC